METSGRFVRQQFLTRKSSRRAYVTPMTKRIAMLIGIATSLATLGAQEPRLLAQPDSVPIDLATGLMSSGSIGTEPQILVGTLPDWFAKRIVLPPGAHILGAAFEGTAVVGVASIAGTPSQSLMPDLHRDLLAHGWKNPPPPAISSTFRAAPDPLRLSVCAGDDEYLTVLASPHHGTSTTITYRLVTYSINGPCRPLPAPRFRPLYPLLYDPPAPADPRLFTGCQQALSGTSGTRTAFAAAMSNEKILDHYARQLADSGWAIDTRNGSIVGRTWTHPDSGGGTLRLSLVVSPMQDSTCHEVNMQVRPVRKP